MIPRLMCTQHPDATVKVTASEEVDEAIVAYTAYGCDEVMIDYEGKTTPYAQPKDITVKAHDSGLPLGEKFYLTPRMPNPRLEEFERSMLTLEAAILANYFSAKLTGRQAIRWVVLPMVADVETLGLVYRMLIHKTEAYTRETGVKLEPPELIPLIEDAVAQLKADELIGGLLKQMSQPPRYLRLFLGKSDSAVKHGHIASALAIVATLSKVKAVERELGVKIYPILGMGSPPFRGAINNPTLSHLEVIQYAGYYTATIQSAVRYDTSYDEYTRVRESILNACCLPSRDIDTPEVEGLITKASSTYRSLIVKYAERVVQVARLVPGTRDRVSWAVYGRNITAEDRVVNMPRAIVYTSTWYAMGLPPIFLDAPTVVELAKSDQLDVVLRALPTLKREWEYDAQFFDPQTAAKYTSEELVKTVQEAMDYLGINARASGTYLSLLRMNRNESNILAMGKFRKFLG
ncbi:phosphoenolpyruvate carboxylase [Pyrobaculum neutrophilum]|uniref:Phosphoenolpyruvate carboxylase n=1 Tax=Pyrobaculum neutrophilum (strain DSM 2338 / JCM 9278 / NBRC 100436 / V24Sta) TaxID=444157 RepID=B1YBY2_PYRNV|nr:phosphoenolpyruvate carboxylase [Pyrobaculum neutrophilum]ACB39366.1 phosphoenolpyruvate carboxylase [Pyrobaculum neutrophilum V24Sta]